MAGPPGYDEQVAALVQELRRLAKGSSEVAFGEVAKDEVIIDAFDALLGTLKAARSQGLISFEGDLLLVGSHDGVKIQLLDEEFLKPVPAAAVASGDAAEEFLKPVPAAAVASGDAAEAETEAETEADHAAASAASLEAASSAANLGAGGGEAGSEALDGASGASGPGAFAAEDGVAGAAATSGGEAKEGEEEEWIADPGSVGRRAEEVERQILDSRRSTGGARSGGNDSPATANAERAAAASARSAAAGQGKWQQADVSYINQRTREVENLEGRRASLANAPPEAAYSETTKKEGDAWKVDTSYIKARTEQVENLDGRKEAMAEAVNVAELSSTATKDGDQWKIDTSYIQTRTKEVENLEGRRASLATAPPDAAYSESVKKEGDSWKVDTSYIKARTEQVENLDARKEAIAAGTVNVAELSASVKKDGDAWKVDTDSYLRARTKQVDNLEERREAAVSNASEAAAVVAASSASTRRQSDGSWRVDTSGYLSHRTRQVDNLDSSRTQQAAAAVAGACLSSPSRGSSAGLRRHSDGSWRVDTTSYINHRTDDTANLTRLISEAAEDEKYADPKAAKYPYDQLKGAGNRPNDVDPTKKELYLADGEFQIVFGVSLPDYLKLPRWKQQNLRKAKDLF